MATKLFALLILSFGLLSACLSRADLSSRIEFLSIEQAEEAAQFVKMKLREKISKEEGECITRETNLVCRLPVRNGPAIVVFAGTNSAGYAFLVIQTATSHLLPVSNEKFQSGQMVPEEHKAWEQWAVRSFSQFQPQERVRSYSNNQIGKIGTF